MNINEQIADFITKAAPALKLSCNYLSLDELLNLYKSESFSVTEILSDADEATDSATYLISLIPNIRSKKGHIKCKCLNMKS